MSDNERIQVQLTGAQAGIAALVADFESVPAHVKIISTESKRDPTSWEFGLNEAASVATIMSLAFYLGDLGARVVQYLNEPNDTAPAAQYEQRRIAIQTPAGRLEFVSSKDLTEQEVNQKLRDALKLYQ